MNEAILTALITSGVTLAMCLINNNEQRKRDAIVRDADRKEMQRKQDEMINDLKNDIKMIDYRIKTLSEHVESHNKVVDRTYDLEKKADVLAEKIAVANHRIDDLER